MSARRITSRTIWAKSSMASIVLPSSVVMVTCMSLVLRSHLQQRRILSAWGRMEPTTGQG